MNWRKPLLIGVVLRVPSAAGAAAASGWTGVYVVRPGDTLSGIALRYHVSLGQLAAANGFDPNGVLLIGARLRDPDGQRPALDLAHVVQSNPTVRRGRLRHQLPELRRPAAGVHEFAVIGLNGTSVHREPVLRRPVGRRAPPRSVYINTAYQRDPLPAHHARLRRRREEPAAAGPPRGAPTRSAAARRPPRFAARGHGAAGDLARRRAGEHVVVASDAERATIKGILDAPSDAVAAPGRRLLERELLAADRRRLVVARASRSGSRPARPDPPGCPARLRRRPRLAQPEHRRRPRRRHGLLSGASPRPLVPSSLLCHLRVPVPEGTPLRAVSGDDRARSRGVRRLRGEPRRDGALPGRDPLQGLRLHSTDYGKGKAAKAKERGGGDSGSGLESDSAAPRRRARPRAPPRRRPPRGLARLRPGQTSPGRAFTAAARAHDRPP